MTQDFISGQGWSTYSNSDRQTVPEAFESDIAVDPRHSFARPRARDRLPSAPQRPSLTNLRGIRTLPVSVQLANHHIRWVTDDRTSNTRNVSTQETHPSLLQRVIALFWFPQSSVDVIDGRLKGCEFHHCVWDLPAPERV